MEIGVHSSFEFLLNEQKAIFHTEILEFQPAFIVLCTATRKNFFSATKLRWIYALYARVFPLESLNYSRSRNY